MTEAIEMAQIKKIKQICEDSDYEISQDEVLMANQNRGPALQD